MDKIERHRRRKKGIRKKLHGTAGKPRITVFKSNRNIYVQAIDDESGRTLFFSSSKEISGKKTVEGSHEVGKALGLKLKKHKITHAVFDRNGYIYHGRVKAVAEGVRKSGIKI